MLWPALAALLRTSRKTECGAKRFLISLAVRAAPFALLIFANGSLRAQNATAAGNPENGKKLYVVDGCYECHGSVGQGGTGPRLGPRPIANAVFAAYVRKPAGVMPAYRSKVLTDAELVDIRAYLASVPEPPPVKGIRLLNQ